MSHIVGSGFNREEKMKIKILQRSHLIRVGNREK